MKEERRQYLKSREPSEQIIQGLLEPNESILWHDQPIRAYLFWSGIHGDTLVTKILSILVGLIVLLPFSAPGGFWAYTSTRELIVANGAASIAPITLKVVLGVLLALTPYAWAFRSQIRAWRIAKYIHYVITSRRVMMLYIKQGYIVDKRIKPFNAMAPLKLVPLSLTGVGNIIFDSEGEAYSSVDSGTSSAQSFDVGLDGVANAREVLAILRNAMGEHGIRRRS